MNDDEIWRDLYGYEGLYEISSYGNIRSLNRKVWNGTNYHIKKGQDIKTFIGDDGYVIVQLSKNGVSKTMRVHRLVALTFLSTIEGKDFIDHINTIRTDNRVENLRWVTRTENMNNTLTLKKKSESVLGVNNPNAKKVVCLNNGVIFDTIIDAATAYNIDSSSNITSCCKGKLKSVGVDESTGEKLVWVYLKDYENMNESDIENRLNNSKPVYAMSSVRCKNTGEVFSSIKEASEKYCICESNIRRVCSGKGKTTNNGLNPNERLVWEYVEKRGDE